MILTRWPITKAITKIITKAKGRSAKVLIIGDSMVKHIEEKKISRAARGMFTCHSYSGAKVKDIHQNFQQSSYNDDM